jgi:hypothetical protein
VLLAVALVAAAIPVTMLNMRVDRPHAEQRPDLQRVLVALTSGSERIAPGATAYVAGPHGPGRVRPAFLDR